MHRRRPCCVSQPCYEAMRCLNGSGTGTDASHSHGDGHVLRQHARIVRIVRTLACALAYAAYACRPSETKAVLTPRPSRAWGSGRSATRYAGGS
jgi:hypothetical protein